MAQLYLTGGPSPQKDTQYRYYTCELKWNMWECSRNEHPFEQKELSRRALASKLIPINDWIPKLLDPLILKYKVNPPVRMRTW